MELNLELSQTCFRSYMRMLQAFNSILHLALVLCQVLFCRSGRAKRNPT